ncbi:MAG TPA: 3-oxoacyl-ACP reductase family protein [Syntrophales bacterium]|nr:3-oxoacyl-ACP reductase family protein [Syntrophales bacterium]HPX11556.1 3-oxoacyl-ACP reductase family protein [Syntrophales bacterium]HQB29208.1 3-oxoacyl-ACP reductase family protein [Syntrophales bacterium]HQN77467.1 3-oxoacyl-ACP reductase family protein [Syntrophales bacterium]HQQ27643.1 3-oxoacyl-ACP reductase family protein [Syntrophales bacterium]
MTVNKVAIVTGASGGIGAACCRALAGEGFSVGIHYRTGKERAEALSKELPGSFLLRADLGDLGEIDGMVEEIRKTAGRADVLVNNAGMSVNRDIHTMKPEEFDAQRLMTRGAWYLTKRVLRLFMLRKNEGRIINISSIVGHTGNAGQIPYTMEKAALDAMTRSLVRELAGRNILVNSVAPGFIETSMTDALPGEIREGIAGSIPLGRIGRPEEVAEAVAFLAVKGSYITGTVLHVNGGLYGG